MLTQVVKCNAINFGSVIQKTASVAYLIIYNFLLYISIPIACSNNKEAY